MPITDAEKQTILTSIHYFNELLKNADKDAFYSYEKNKVQLEDLIPYTGFGDNRKISEFKQSTLYVVGECDDYGRMDKTLTYVKAHSKYHAYIVAALKLNNPAIACSGYYTSYEIDQNKLDQIRKDAEYTLQQIKLIK